MTEVNTLPAKPYVWHGALWQQCLAQAKDQRLPHALLLSGTAGIGKAVFAQALARFMLCQSPRNDEACGQCKSCLLERAGTHPDFWYLTPETDAKTDKTSKVIKVDQVREVVNFASKSAQMGGYRVVIVSPAHALNVQAANALLKTLEEPGRDTLFLLITDRPMELLPTIRSRCRQMPLTVPAYQEALAWLSPLAGKPESAQLALGIAHGAPLAALSLLEQSWFNEREALAKDLLSVAEGRAPALSSAGRWGKLGAESLLAGMASILEDVTYLGMGQSSAIKNHDLLPIIQRLAARADSAFVLRFLQRLAEKQRLIAANIQPQAIVDSVWLDWASVQRSV